MWSRRFPTTAHKEIQPEEVLDVFRTTYLNKRTPVEVKNMHFIQTDGIAVTVTIQTADGSQIEVSARGNGRLDAVCNAVKIATGWDFTIMTYSEHAWSTAPPVRRPPT